GVARRLPLPCLPSTRERKSSCNSCCCVTTVGAGSYRRERTISVYRRRSRTANTMRRGCLASLIASTSSDSIRAVLFLLAGETLLQESHNGRLLGRQVGEFANQLLFGPGAQHFKHGPVEVGVDDRGVNVRLSRDRGGVAEALGYTLDRADDVSPCLHIGVELLELLEGERGENGARPGAEVLGGEVLAGDLSEVVVHVAGIDH